MTIDLYTLKKAPFGDNFNFQRTNIDLKIAVGKARSNGSQGFNNYLKEVKK